MYNRTDWSGGYMKKKIIIYVVLISCVGLYFMNIYSRETYKMNVIQWIFTNQHLTEDDREFLRERGPLVYGSDDNSPPLRFFDSLTGEYKGLAVDYLRALAIELETEIVFEPMIWDDALKALENGETDLCDMYPSKARSEVYLFSNPVYYQRGIILIPKETLLIQETKQLNGKRVALQKGDYVYEFLSQQNLTIDYVFTRDYEESLMLLQDGDVDAIVGDEPVISYFVSQLKLEDRFHIVDEPLYEMPMVLSTHKSDRRLHQILNKGIFALNKKQIIFKIQQKWFGISTPIGQDTRNQGVRLLLLAVTIMATSVISLIILWNMELKKAVKTRTEALEISRNNLQTMIDGLNHMIVVVRKDWNVLSSNSLFNAWCGEHGIKHLSNQSINLQQVIPGWQDWVKSNWEYGLTPKERIIFGSTFLISPYDIHYEDQLVTYLLMFEDITDKKVNEAKLLQDNKMAAVGQLATGVAHEIRNPLGLIRNYTYLLKKKEGDLSILNQALPIIEEAVDRASTIIDNLLNFSRLSDDQKRLVDIKSMVENVVKLNDRLMNRSHIECKVVLTPIKCEVYEESLKHIIMNMMNNAIDAMPKSGQLTIWLKQGQVGPIIHIIDTGMGMSSSTLEKLFDPFFTTKKVGEGTGLGLYIAYNELQKTNGRIEVISKEGVGTTFKVFLLG
jgi:signal transduction histidine kinase/ABC-type amino acid transport substrate-binding protein